jgi:hypothetical protein
MIRKSSQVRMDLIIQHIKALSQSQQILKKIHLIKHQQDFVTFDYKIRSTPRFDQYRISVFTNENFGKAVV